MNTPGPSIDAARPRCEICGIEMTKGRICGAPRCKKTDRLVSTRQVSMADQALALRARLLEAARKIGISATWETIAWAAGIEASYIAQNSRGKPRKVITKAGRQAHDALEDMVLLAELARVGSCYLPREWAPASSDHSVFATRRARQIPLFGGPVP